MYGFSASNIYLVKLNKIRHLGLYQRVFQYSIQVRKQFEQTPKKYSGNQDRFSFHTLRSGSQFESRVSFKCLTFETLDVTNTLHCKYWMVQPLDTGGLFVGSSKRLPVSAFPQCVCVYVSTCLLTTYLVQKRSNVMCKDFLISLLLKNDG